MSKPKTGTIFVLVITIVLALFIFGKIYITHIEKSAFSICTGENLNKTLQKMFKNNNEKQNLSNFPTAPPAYDDQPHRFREPPPSYEESQQMNTVPSAPQAQANHLPYQQPQLPQHHHNQSQYYGMQGVVPTQQPVYGYPNPYQMHMMQHQQYYQTAVMPSSSYPANVTMVTSNADPNPQVLTLAKGAKIRTNVAGAVNIPPPPPGCAATPAQLAAMQGQPVLVKKKKNSFF